MLATVAAAAGLLTGSLLTVVVDRVHRGPTPGSRCGSCGWRLGPCGLVPVVSWLVLRGRCRRCGASIGAGRLVVELVTAAVFVAFSVALVEPVTVAAFCVLGAGLVALTWIDLRAKRLPREITYVTMLIGAPLLAVAAVVEGAPSRIGTAAGGAVLALTIMGGLFAVSRGGLGDGDVRLSPLLGMYLGWVSLSSVLVGIFLGFVFGAAVSVALLAVGRAGRTTALPFGPFLALGTIVGVLLTSR